VLTRNVKQGETITLNDLMTKRPGSGIAPEFSGIIAGRSARVDLEKDAILMWDMV
jgi:N-acetylneuraminate synthase